MSIDLKIITPDASINDSAVLFGADSQASASPSVYAVSTLRAHIQSSGFPDGSAAAPSITNEGDLNTGFWFPAADTIAASTAGAERMRITSAGAVLIGTTTATGNTLTTVNTDSTTTSITNQYHQYNSGATSGSGTKTGSNILMVALPAYAGTGAWLAYNGNMTNQSPNTVSQFRAFSTAYVSTGGGTLTNYYGYFSNDTTLTSGTVTNTYGFYGNISSGTNKWNFYAGGTANNYFAGNVGIGTVTFGTSASKVLALGNATAPTTGPADTIQIYSTDLSAGNTMLSLYTEGTPVNANTTAAATHRIAIRVNGTVYYLLANTAA